MLLVHQIQAPSFNFPDMKTTDHPDLHLSHILDQASWSWIEQAKMLTKIFVFSLFVLIVAKWQQEKEIRAFCPYNCKCSESKSVCHIWNCASQIFVDTEALVVRGVLCPHHYGKLQRHPEVGVLLLDSPCGILPKCR